VEEIDVELTHRATGTDLAGQLHRASQLADVTRALAARGLVRRLRDRNAPDGVTGLLKRLGRGSR
jgi:glucosyl-3-phosphoglycerate synthase